MYYTHKLAAKCILPAFLLVGSVYANVRGTIDAESGWYPAGSNLTVTATLAPYRYVEWSGDTNDAQITATTITFTVSGARQLNATFDDHVTADSRVPWWWLASVFTNLTTDSSSNEFETAVSGFNGSGLTVAQAYWTGTDPIADDARFGIASVTMVGGQVQLSWAHAHVDTNLPPIVIDGCASLANRNWVPIGTNAVVDGTVSWNVPEQTEYRFFRLRAETP